MSKIRRNKTWKELLIRAIPILNDPLCIQIVELSSTPSAAQKTAKKREDFNSKKVYAIWALARLKADYPLIYKIILNSQEKDIDKFIDELIKNFS